MKRKMRPGKVTAFSAWRRAVDWAARLALLLHAASEEPVPGSSIRAVMLSLFRLISQIRQWVSGKLHGLAFAACLRHKVGDELFHLLALAFGAGDLRFVVFSDAHDL